MKYELCKELKDTGFPQRSGFHASNAENCDCKTKGLATSCHLAYIPTLLELIEACGEKFRKLVLHTDFGSWKDRPKWQAKPNRHKVPKNIRSTKGETPEEAVAKLWLAVNEKVIPKSPPQTLKSNL